MTINAYEKIKQTLVDACGEFGFQKFDLSDSNLQKQNQWMIESGCMEAIQNFREKYPNAKITVQVFAFDSGLEFFNIQYLYRNKKDQLSSKKELVFVHNHQTLMRVVFRSKRKTYLNLLQDLEEDHSSFPIGEKQVEIREVVASIGKTDNSCFTSYHNLTDLTLLQEVYSQGSAYEQQDYSNHLDNNDQLTVRYRNQNPVFAQFHGELLLEDFGYDPDSTEAALEVVKAVNEELDAICKKIKSTISDHLETGAEVQKRITMKQKFNV